MFALVEAARVRDRLSSDSRGPLILRACVRVALATAGGIALVAFRRRRGRVPDRGRCARGVSLPGTPYGIAIDRLRRRLWVTLTASDTLAELSIAGASLRLVRTYPTARQPNTVAVDVRDGEVFVADAGAGEIQTIKPPAG